MYWTDYSKSLQLTSELHVLPQCSRHHHLIPILSPEQAITFIFPLLFLQPKIYGIQYVSLLCSAQICLHIMSTLCLLYCVSSALHRKIICPYSSEHLSIASLFPLLLPYRLPPSRRLHCMQCTISNLAHVYGLDLWEQPAVHLTFFYAQKISPVGFHEDGGIYDIHLFYSGNAL